MTDTLTLQALIALHEKIEKLQEEQIADLKKYNAQLQEEIKRAKLNEMVTVVSEIQPDHKDGGNIYVGGRSPYKATFKDNEFNDYRETGLPEKDSGQIYQEAKAKTFGKPFSFLKEPGDTATVKDPCPFSKETHIRRDGAEISEIARTPEDVIRMQNPEFWNHIWTVSFAGEDTDTYNNSGAFFASGKKSPYDIITREEYARINSEAQQATPDSKI